MARRFVHIAQWQNKMEAFTTSQKAKEYLFFQGYWPNIDTPNVLKDNCGRLATVKKLELK